MLRCSICREYKTTSEFSPTKQARSGYSSHCKPCRSERHRTRWNYETARHHSLKTAYGITLADYNALVEAQGGVCAICAEPPKEQTMGRFPKGRPRGTFANLRVDHDHATGKIRELLCNSCNSAIAYMREDPALALKMIAYLKKHSS